MTTEGSNSSMPPASGDAEESAEDGETPEGADGAPAEEVDPLEAARKEAEKYRDQLLRTAADFDNFKKRARREQVDAELSGRDELLRQMLPVFDNLERAVAHAESATDVQSLADGIRMVMKQFTETLNRVSIERVASVGVPFDPSVHEAIQHLETDQQPPGSIAAEVQGGYKSRDRLIRPALVVVAKAPAGASKPPERDDDAPPSSNAPPSQGGGAAADAQASPSDPDEGSGEST